MYITDFPDNIIGTLFKLLKAAMNIANLLVENLMRTPSEIFSGWLEQSGLPDWLNNLLTAWTKFSNPIYSNLTLFDILIGGAFILILIIGIIKFFGDSIGL